MKAHVRPHLVAEAVDTAPLADLLQALDAGADLADAFGPWEPCRCPACGRRAVEVADAATAWCASCGATHTRWALAGRVLADSGAVRRVASALQRRG
jgi:hypothetical protein